MRHNKVLGLAIASALALGASSSFGGELTIKYVSRQDTTPGNCNPVAAGPAILASEVFFSGGDPVIFNTSTCNPDQDNLDGATAGVDGPAPHNNPEVDPGTYNDGFFYAIYNFDSDTFDTLPFLVDFTLSNAAQFGNISLTSGTGLDFVAHPSGSHSGVVKNSGGGAGDSSVTFYVTPATGVGNNFRVNQDVLFLRFSMKNLGVLKSPDAEIKMTAKVYGDIGGGRPFDLPAPTETVATSARATRVELDSSSGSVQIDVAQGNKLFAGISGTDAFISTTKAKLGSVTISGNNPSPLNVDGTPWNFKKHATATGILTVTDAPLSASADPGRIFLDLNGNNTYDSTATPPADILGTIKADQTTAEWNLTTSQLGDLYGIKANIVLEVDGANAIEEQSDAAKATLVINYGGDNIDRFNRDLIHIKRNGVICSIYNVPAPGAMDVGNIRITNTSGTDGVEVSGSLRDKNGEPIFTNKLLVEKMGPNETKHITTDPTVTSADSIQLDGIEKDPTWTTNHSNESWKGRAVLTINSNSSSLEIYGLVRNKAGGPLTNMSVGATGNGCD
ncbi:hypothetical protein THII_0373 [Thioploca ingrica]|uniref:Uncharacterized protein n=1 Tax=Thioploca ingrica TaxID=40754 RepID=A0A090AIL0_9GAMM|nr:hypothetical protein THII_0373 [Thioploca ingrica]